MLNSIFERGKRIFSGVKTTEMTSAEAFYNQLYSYYGSNGLYDALMSASFYLDKWHEAMQPLRNPANRSVEFFVSKVMPGVLPSALPIMTENDRIVDPIHRIWKWTNLSAKKSTAVRWLSIYGDLWIHPNSNPEMNRVYLQFVRPQVITDWKEDERGNVIQIRIDVSIGNGRLHTEYWTPEEYWIWEHSFGKNTPVNQLGGPVDFGFTSELGIDFVPYVHVKFRDVGEKRGFGAYTHALDKIDEANRMATRLHQMLFRYNKPLWALQANGMDPTGRPLPPPSLPNKEPLTNDLSEDDVIRLPGNSSIDTMVPDIRYGDALSILQDMMGEIEKDLPELAYYKMKEQGSLSGRAVRLLLSDAIDRALEARANLEQGLIRADQMALTMGQSMGLWRNIGTYERGELEHSFQEREIFPIGFIEKAEGMRTLVEAGVPFTEAALLADIPLVGGDGRT